MTTTNHARFKINGTASEDAVTGDRGFDATNGQVITLVIEASTTSALSVTYFLFDSTDSTSPLASKSAPAVNFAGSGTPTQVVSTPSSAATFTMPVAGVHSYTVRAVAAIPGGSDTYERIVSIRAPGSAIRKITAAETTQYNQRGYSDTQNDMVDAFAEHGTAGDVDFDDTAWVAEPTFTSFPAVVPSDVQGALDGILDTLGVSSYRPTDESEIRVDAGSKLSGSAIGGQHCPTMLPVTLKSDFLLPELTGCFDVSLADSWATGAAKGNYVTPVTSSGSPGIKGLCACVYSPTGARNPAAVRRVIVGINTDQTGGVDHISFHLWDPISLARTDIDTATILATLPAVGGELWTPDAICSCGDNSFVVLFHSANPASLVYRLQRYVVSGALAVSRHPSWPATGTGPVPARFS